MLQITFFINCLYIIKDYYTIIQQKQEIIKQDDFVLTKTIKNAQGNIYYKYDDYFIVKFGVKNNMIT